jgi:hypothetical protein
MPPENYPKQNIPGLDLPPDRNVAQAPVENAPAAAEEKTAEKPAGQQAVEEVKAQTAAQLEEANTKEELLAIADNEGVEANHSDNKHDIAKAIVAARRKAAKE